MIRQLRCPYCHAAVRPHDEKAACHACMSWHHRACWDEHGCCAACQSGQAVGAQAGKDPASKDPPQEAGQDPPAGRDALRERARVPMPRGIEVDDRGSDLRLSRRWFTPMALFLVFFCAAWDAFLVFWYGMALTQKEVPWLMVVFPIGHLAVGVGLSYFTLCLFLNRTVVSIAGGLLTVRHGPLPWPGNRELPVDDLEQLYCEEVISRGKNGTSRTWKVHALDRRGAQVTLLSGLDDRTQARFIEQTVEEWLEIEDRPVEGEDAEGRRAARPEGTRRRAGGLR